MIEWTARGSTRSRSLTASGSPSTGSVTSTRPTSAVDGAERRLPARSRRARSPVGVDRAARRPPRSRAGVQQRGEGVAGRQRGRDAVALASRRGPPARGRSGRRRRAARRSVGDASLGDEGRVRRAALARSGSATRPARLSYGPLMEAGQQAIRPRGRLAERGRLRRHPLRDRGRHRQDHDRPARGAQRVPARDADRDLGRARAGARGHLGRRDRAHRRGAAGLLLGRRPARARRHRLRRRRRRGRALPRHRPAGADAPAAEADRRDGRRLRDRRRPRAARRLRPHDRRRQRALRPDRPEGRLLRRRLRRQRCWPPRSARRRPRRSGSSAASTTRSRRSTWGS